MTRVINYSPVRSYNPDATPLPSVAPALRNFYHDLMISVSALRVGAPWLSQLRILELKFTPTQRPRATTIRVLYLLGNLHILEVLKISAERSSFSLSTNKRLRPIELPRLHRLGLDCEELDDYVYFLEHIIPRQKCTLSLYSTRFFGPADEKYADKFASLAEHFSADAQALGWNGAQVLSWHGEEGFKRI